MAFSRSAAANGFWMSGASAQSAPRGTTTGSPGARALEIHDGSPALSLPGRGGVARRELPAPGPPYVVTVCGKATGLRLKFWSTARTPNCTLSLAMLSVTEVTLPTGIAWVQSESVVCRTTTS